MDRSRGQPACTVSRVVHCIAHWFTPGTPRRMWGDILVDGCTFADNQAIGQTHHTGQCLRGVGVMLGWVDDMGTYLPRVARAAGGAIFTDRGSATIWV